MNTTISKVKTHIKKNRSVYFWSGITAVAVIAGFKLVHQCKSANTVLGDGNFTGNGTVLNYKIDITTSVDSKYGNKLGRPGNEVIDLDNPLRPPFKSQRLAARDAGVSDMSMYYHLNGDFPDLNGRHFARREAA